MPKAVWDTCREAGTTPGFDRRRIGIVVVIAVVGARLSFCGRGRWQARYGGGGTRCDGQAWCSVSTDLARWREDKLAVGWMAVLECWRNDELAAGRMVVRACLPDDDSTMGRTTMPCYRWPTLARRRNDKSVVGWITMVLTRWRGNK